MPASIRHLTDRRVNYYSLLARWKDGLYYSAALIKCDKTNKRCRVCFEDGSEIWVSNKEIHLQLQADKLVEDEDIVCCICDDGSSEPPNEIILCDVCNQGYHQKCHNPPVDSSKLDGTDDVEQHIDWFCATCSFILNQTNRSKPDADPQQQSKEQPKKSGTEKSEGSSKSETSGAHNKQETKIAPKIKAPETQEKGNKLPSNATKSTPTSQHATDVVASTTVQTIPKAQPPKVKQTPIIQQQTKATIGPVKSSVSLNQRPAPYYPLSSQVRATATPSASTAALASMTASSALVVGSHSSGRTKQDLVKQSNRSSQRQFQLSSSSGSFDGVTAPTVGVAVASASISPPKHAVRKSGSNYPLATAATEQLVRQSALPTATRSSPVTAPPSAVSSGSTIGIAATTIMQPQHQATPQSKIQLTVSNASATPSAVGTVNITVNRIPNSGGGVSEQQRSLDKLIKNAVEFRSNSGGEQRSVVTTAAAVAAQQMISTQRISIESTNNTRPYANSHHNHSNQQTMAGTLIQQANSKQVGVIKEPIHSSVEHQQRDAISSSSSPNSKMVNVGAPSGAGSVKFNKDERPTNNTNNNNMTSKSAKNIGADGCKNNNQSNKIDSTDKTNPT